MHGSGFLPWGPDSESAGRCCQQHNSFKVHPPPFSAHAVHPHVPLNPASTVLPHRCSKATAQSRLTGWVWDGCMWAGPLFSTTGCHAVLLIMDMAVAGERSQAGPGHRIWFPLSHRYACVYTRSFGCIENVYHIPSRHCWSRKCLKYISGVVPCITRAMVVCSTQRYACPLLIKNCSTLSAYIAAQPLRGMLCLLVNLHTSQRFAFWSMNGVARNRLLCWYAPERIIPSFPRLFIVYQRCLISDKQKRWILGNLAIIKSRVSRMAL